MSSLISTPIIELDHVNVRYGKTNALRDVSLAIAEGSVCALLGRNGAGKSSLVRCLLGMQKPTGGAVRLFGSSVWTDRARLMPKIGVVPEDSDAPPELTVRQIEQFCASLYSNWSSKSVADRLARFGVATDKPFGQLSKGQKRQVSLALALATSPDLLVLDDPTLGLDVVARKALFEELISELSERRLTVLITTHDLPGVEGLADRVAILREGVVALDEEMETLKWRFRRLRFVDPKARAAAGVPELEQLRAVGVRPWGTGIEAVVSNFDDLSLEQFRKTSGVRDVEVTPMSLEEIFIAVSGE